MALQDLTMMLPSRLGCPLSLKTANMGNPGLYGLRKAMVIPAKGDLCVTPPPLKG